MRKIIQTSILGLILSFLVFYFLKEHFIITEVLNNPESIIKPSNELVFYFDNVQNEDYDLLLNNYLVPGMNKMWGESWKNDDTWTKAVKLRIWVRDFLDVGGWIEGNEWTSVYENELISISDILEHRKLGLDGYCSYYATFYMHSCLAIGINNRRVGWWQPNAGDQINEVYIPEMQKWIAVSPLFNAWFSDENGNALSVTELNQYKHANKINKIITQRDGQATYPDPEIFSKNWLANYSWDIYFWNKNGLLLLDSSEAYRYENPSSWPYEHFVAEYITDSTQDEKLLYFDASLIKVNPSINQSKLSIEIEDYSVINFKEFVWELSDEQGTVLNRGQFNCNNVEIPLKNLNGRKYCVSVYALNSRLGKSNSVDIKIEKVNTIPYSMISALKTSYYNASIKQ